MKLPAFLSACFSLIFASLAAGADPQWITYEGREGPGKGKHVVFLTGDEEYRSEEGLPMLAKILSQRHGFKSTVLFPVDPDGTINPKNQKSLPGSEALDSADAIVMLLRFRQWPDEVTARFEKAFLAGKPIVALRTSTHPFNFPKESKWAKWTWSNAEGGFGRQVFGETWVTHWGNHKTQATRAVIEPSAKDHPLLRGVADIFGLTDVYEAYPPADATILLRGQVLAGMGPDSPPAQGKKKRASDKAEQGINDPMMPVAWTREVKNEAGATNKILCTTMGDATDLESESLRRLVVNGVYWGLGLPVPEKADVAYVDEYQPSFYGFDGYRKGIRPADHALGKVLPGTPLPKPAATSRP